MKGICCFASINIIKDKMATISIIVPIYNVEKYLEKCIKSIICQTYKEIEIILVDDGSTDKCREICDYFSAIDSRVHTIHQDNQGLVIARKNGLKIATGEYIGFVDGDDYIDPYMFEKMMNEIQDPNIDVVHTGFFQDDSIVVSNIGYIYGDNESNRVKNVMKYILDFNSSSIIMPSLCTKLFKRDVIIDAYSYVSDRQMYGEDLICIFALLCKGYNMKCVPQAFYYYRVREDSITHIKTKSKYTNEAGLFLCLVDVTIQIGIYDKMIDYLNYYFRIRMIDVLKKNGDKNIGMEKYKLQNISQYINKKVVIYGAGSVGIDIYSQMTKYKNIDIVAWIDRNYQKYNYDFINVESVDKIKEYEYDYILIAIKNSLICEDVINYLEKLGVNPQKINIINVIV